MPARHSFFCRKHRSPWKTSKALNLGSRICESLGEEDCFDRLVGHRFLQRPCDVVVRCRIEKFPDLSPGHMQAGFVRFPVGCSLHAAAAGFPCSLPFWYTSMFVVTLMCAWYSIPHIYADFMKWGTLSLRWKRTSVQMVARQRFSQYPSSISHSLAAVSLSSP